MPDLAALILELRGDRSYDDLVRDCGGIPSRSRLGQIINEPLANFPDPATIRGLSTGLKVPVTTIVYAAAESLGLDMRRDLPRLAEVLPPGAERLTTRQVNAVVSLVDVILSASNDQQGTSETSQTQERPGLRSVARRKDEKRGGGSKR